jgi:hypothetical protein
LVAASITVATPAGAEPIAPLVHEESSGTVADRTAYASLGVDGAFVTTLGGAFGIAPAGARLGLSASGDITWVFGNADFDDFRLRAGLRAEAIRYRWFRARVAFTPSLRVTSTEMFQSSSFGTELRVAPGVELGRWSFELDAGLEQEWLAYIAPTDRYRREAYAGAVSGYYGMTGRTLRLGAGGATRVGAFEIYAAGGWERTASLDILPAVYATLGVAARF